MEQVFRIKIANTEYAAVEIVPTEDGIEIVLKRVEKEKPVRDTDRDNAPRKVARTDNHAILKEFCTEKKAELKWDKTMLNELVKFYEWWEPRMEDFKGTAQPEKLWKNWIKTMGKK